MSDTETILVWPAGADDPAQNMAWDETLITAAVQEKRPVLRFYGWTLPAATFGYFQRYQEVEGMTDLRPLVRRPTGGGLVPHDRDWTYSLVFPPGHAWFRMRAKDSYAALHQWIQQSFEKLSVDTELAPQTREEGPGRCFVGAEQHDLLWQDRKIAGAAQRRTRQGLLIQGSLQPPTGVRREDWELALRETATRSWQWSWQSFEPGDSLRTRMKQLVEEKYGNPAFIRKR